jgi:DHA3 family macrolide efflux protein-like MFS transporter
MIWKRTFAIIWTGQFFSALSSSIASFAVVFWLSIEHNSAQVLAFGMIAALLPQLILGSFIGVYIDRWKRKPVMICADMFIAACTAVICIMFYIGKVEVWQIYILLAMRSVGSAFHSPAMKASVPLLAPESELMRISGINQIIYSVSNIAGPAIAAAMIGVLDMEYILMSDIAGAVIACTLLLFVTIPNPEKSGKVPDFLQEFKIGLKAIFKAKGMKWLFFSDLAAMFFIIPISAIFPLLTLNHFMGNTYQMSAVEIVWSAGMLLGGALVSTNKLIKFNKVVLIAVMCVLNGLMFAFSGFLGQNGFWWFAFFTAISGMAAAVWGSAFMVIMQTNIDIDKQGRAFSAYDSLSLLPSIPGLMATGFIADAIGLTNSFIYAGIAIFVIGVVILCIPSAVALGKTATNQQS